MFVKREEYNNLVTIYNFMKIMGGLDEQGFED